MRGYRARRENVRSIVHNYEMECCRGPMQPIYRFGDGVIEDAEIVLDDKKLHMPGFEQDVDLDLPNRYQDMV
jgi:acetoacetyl-[acyl-carrier protein] synthase